MKVVTLCQGGNVRSVGLKYILSYKYRHDVIPCGWESNTAETRKMLFEWADKIVIMQPQMKQYVPEEFYKDKNGEQKIFCYDVGEDVFGYAFHPKLQAALNQLIEKHGLFNK